MFMECYDINEIDLSKFDSRNVKNMYSMFNRCTSLTSVNLANLDTSAVTHIGGMFFNCCNLESLYLSSFNTSKLTNVHYMFYNCSKLTILDLSMFDTSLVEEMYGMFSNCTALLSLNLSNFNFIRVLNIYNMFEYCNSLEFLNLENSKINQPNTADIFAGIFNNIIICSNDDNWKNVLENNSINTFININCENYPDTDIKCFQRNVQLTYNKYICSKCGRNYYMKNNVTINNMTYLNCYEKPEGFYLNIDDTIPIPIYFKD